MEYEKGKRLKRRYEIISTLGQGGFGYTYKAIDHLLNRFVAIKSSEHSLSHEAKILKALNNVPHISHIYDYFVEDKVHFIVMRLIEGTSLSKYRVDCGGKVSVSFIKEVLPSVLITLDQMHERGIIHRDISPGNFIFSEKDNKLYLIDFGAATGYLDNSLKNKNVYEHKGLDAPEYANVDAQGPWTDVYSLSMSIVYLLTGEGLPTIEDRLQCDTLPGILMRMSLSGKMQNALMSGLAIDPSMRCKTIKAFAKNFLGEETQTDDMGPTYSVHYHAKTDIGKRDVNQDNFMVDKLFAYAGEDCEIKGYIECEKDEVHVVAIADGVASSNHAELASKAAVQAVSHFVDYYRHDTGLLQNLIEEFLNQLNEKIITLGKKMGKTASTIVVFAWRNDDICVANIGDSPAFALKNRKLMCLSEVQTVAKEKIAKGQVPEAKDLHTLSSYLGKKKIAGTTMAHIYTGKIEKGDIYMLCSDGISSISSDEQKKRWMKKDGDKAMASIFKNAHRHETMDNCTAIILKF